MSHRPGGLKGNAPPPDGAPAQPAPPPDGADGAPAPPGAASATMSPVAPPPDGADGAPAPPGAASPSCGGAGGRKDAVIYINRYKS